LRIIIVEEKLLGEKIEIRSHQKTCKRTDDRRAVVAHHAHGWLVGCCAVVVLSRRPEGEEEEEIEEEIETLRSLNFFACDFGEKMELFSNFTTRNARI
jgi:hypothetical protein